MSLLKVYNVDALSALDQMPDESVQCCVTSPPYWGLRDYGTSHLVWGGDSNCEHVFVDEATPRGNGAGGYSGKQQTNKGSYVIHGPGPRVTISAGCSLCSAWRGELGLEPSPELYVQHIVEIFREVRRVLRNDGTLWLNLGDSYSAQAGQRKTTDKAGIKQQSNVASVGAPSRCAPGLKPKDLVGIPWMAAFALRADGWWLRSDIIWSKPAPMPESVTDRPTKSHEYIFLLTKSQKYYYDHEAIKEPCQSGASDIKKMIEKKDRIGGKHKVLVDPLNAANCTTHIGNKRGVGSPNGRNKRSVWTVNTRPFNDAHFATFPPELIVPCILAGCPSGGTVLDVCAGSGTVGKVAIELGRKAVLIEPSEDYCKMIEARTTTTIGLPLT